MPPRPKKSPPPEPEPEEAVSDRVEMSELPKLNLAEALMQADEERTEIDKVIQHMTDPSKINHNTEVSSREAFVISTLDSLGQKYRLKTLNGFLHQLKELRVSKGRQGRKEFVKMVTHQMAQDMPQEGAFSRAWGRLTGRRKEG